jgi:hypothetical protein
VEFLVYCYYMLNTGVVIYYVLNLDNVQGKTVFMLRNKEAAIVVWQVLLCVVVLPAWVVLGVLWLLWKILNLRVR